MSVSLKTLGAEQTKQTIIYGFIAFFVLFVILTEDVLSMKKQGGLNTAIIIKTKFNSFVRSNSLSLPFGPMPNELYE